jgi:hypothetical protein
MGLASLIAVVAAVYGFASAGIVGAFSGLVSGIAVGSGAMIAMSSVASGVLSPALASGAAQRLGGLIAVIGGLVGALYGGWSRGWLFSVLGYGFGMVCSFPLKLLLGIGDNAIVATAVAEAETTEQMDQQQMSGRQIFNGVLSKFAYAATLLILAAYCVGFLLDHWPVVGKVGAWAYFAYVAYTIIFIFVTNVVPSLLGYFYMLRSRQAIDGEPWLSVALLVKLAEVFLALVGCGYVGKAAGYIR